MVDALKYGRGNGVAADAANAVGVIAYVVSRVDAQEQQGVPGQRIQCLRNHCVQHLFKVTAGGAKAHVIVVIRAFLQLPTVFVPQMAGGNVAKHTHGIHLT